MFKNLLPRHDGFYSIFIRAAEVLIAASQQLPILLNDLPNAATHAKNIKHFETQGDLIAREAFDVLHKTFITPFDRNDIHKFIGKLDDILDLINHTARLISIYHITTVPEEIISLANLSEQAANSLQIVIKNLNSLKNINEILHVCDEIHRVKNNSEQTLLAGFEKLFQQETDFKRLLMLKEIYEHIHEITDQCEDLANIIKGMVLEYS